MMSNVGPAQQPVNMGTNAGIAKLTEQGDFPTMKNAYHNPDGMATIQSMGLTVDELKKSADGSYMWMDTRYKDAIYIINPRTGEVEEYPRMSNGLYGRKLPESVLQQIRGHRSDTEGPTFGPQEEMEFVQTVHGNIEGFPKRRVAAALRARQLYHSLSHPSLKDFKNIIRAGQIRDCPVTMQAVEDAEAIFGPDLAALKGKLVKRKAPPVTDSIHAVPDELVEHHKDLPATMDVMYVCNRPYMVFLDTTIRDNVVSPLPNRSTKSFYAALDEAFEHYGTHGFRVKRIHCDGEFLPLLDPIKNDLQIQLDAGPAQEHANTAERFIRTLGERIRAAWHATPFLVMPKVMVDELVAHIAIALTLFPAAEGISSIYSPRQIVTGRTISYNDFKYNFGSYCLGHHAEKTKNNPEPRGLDCIYLRPILENTQGGHKLYDLTSKKVITRQYVTPLPLPPAVVDIVHQKAYSEGMKPLKFHNRAKVEILPVGLPAGVTGNTNQSNEHYLQHMGVDLDWEDDGYVFDDEVPEMTGVEPTAEIVDAEEDDIEPVPPLMARANKQALRRQQRR